MAEPILRCNRNFIATEIEKIFFFSILASSTIDKNYVPAYVIVRIVHSAQAAALFTAFYLLACVRKLNNIETSD